MIHLEGWRIEASAAESNDNFSGIELQDFRSSGDDQCYYFSLLQQSRFYIVEVVVTLAIYTTGRDEMKLEICWNILVTESETKRWFKWKRYDEEIVWFTLQKCYKSDKLRRISWNRCLTKNPMIFGKHKQLKSSHSPQTSSNQPSSTRLITSFYTHLSLAQIESRIWEVLVSTHCIMPLYLDMVQPTHIPSIIIIMLINYPNRIGQIAYSWFT